MSLPISYEAEIKRISDYLKDHLYENLHSLILYGSAVRGDIVKSVSDINILVILDTSTPEAHSVIADAIKSSIRISPFVITRRGMDRSFRAFALKFQSIKRDYKVLAGVDALEDMPQDDHLLKFLCEQGLRNLRLRTVRAFVLNKHDPIQYRKFVVRSIASVFIELSTMLHLEDVEIPHDFSDRIAIIEKNLSTNVDILKRLLSLKEVHSRLSQADVAQIHDQLFRLLDFAVQWMEKKWPAATLTK